MTRPAVDRVKVTCSTVGTGTLTLGGAVPGENVQAFPSSLNGLVVPYAIDHTEAAEWETGYGIYTHSGTTLSRLRVEASSNSNNLVSFSSGVKHVQIAPVSADVVENVASTDPSTEGRSLGYIAGRSRWRNSSTDRIWICLDDDDVSSPSTVAWGKILHPSDLVADSATVTGTTDTISDSQTRTVWKRYTNAGTTTVTISSTIPEDFEGVFVKDAAAGTLNLVGSGLTLNGSGSYEVDGAAFVKREGTGTGLTVFQLDLTGPFLSLAGGTMTGAVDFDGNTLSGNAVALATVSGSLDSTDIGKRLTTSGTINIPTTPTGWWAEIVLGANTHDIQFNSTTLDVSAEGWAAGDTLIARVTSATTINITRIPVADIITQADFS